MVVISKLNSYFAKCRFFALLFHFIPLIYEVRKQEQASETEEMS